MADLCAAIIIPVWNGRDDLPRCLDALLTQEYANLTIIVVDNGSTDGSADLVAAGYPTVTLLRQATNLGFAGACNIGLRHAADECAADALILLNVDTEVHPGWLTGLMAALASDPQVGMAGSKALYPDGAIQHAGAILDPQVGGRHRGLGEPGAGRWDQPGAVDFLSGVSLAISRHAYEVVGGLDEEFSPIYFEDVDWCYRVQAAGLEVVYAPDSVLIHHERSMRADGSYASFYSYQRNRLRLLLKHWPLERLLREFAPAEQAWLQRQRSAEFITAVQRAYMHHLLHLNEMARWRAHFLGESSADADELARLLIALHAVWPLPPTSPVDGKPSAMQALVAQARRQVKVIPQPFRSQTPLIGPLIVWFRTTWNQVAAKWLVLPIVEQQNAYNHTLLQALEQSNQEREQLTAVMGEYVRESAREIGELTDEVRRLRVEDALQDSSATLDEP